MRNITLSAREADIAAARERARAEHTTLNEQFRRWLAEYGRRVDTAAEFDALMDGLTGQFELGGAFTRDQRNAR